MAKEIRNYSKLAVDIIEAVGGADNIRIAQRCATRLRLELIQEPEDAKDKISKMPGVITVVKKSGQFQVVIGNHVGDVFDVVSKELNLDTNTEKDQKGEKASIGNRVLGAISGIFAPFIFVLAAAGLLQGCLIIASLISPAVAKTGTYEVFNFISWTPFVFLPVLIGITASKRFKCNTYLAVVCCLALVNPSWTEIVARIAEGESIGFLGLKLTGLSYTSTVLPAIFMVLLLSYLERFVKKLMPDSITNLFTPFICMSIMVPLTLLIVGPVTTTAANGVATILNLVYKMAPPIAAAVLGAFWSVMVVFGIHWGLTPIFLANQAALGFDPLQLFAATAVIGQMGAVFGVAFRTKNKDTKKTALSAGATSIFGITEPAIYGISLPMKRPFVFGCIAGAVGSVVASLFGSVYYTYAGLVGTLTIFNTMGKNSMSFVGAVIGSVVAVALAFLLTFFFGVKDDIESDQGVIESTNTKKTKGNIEYINSPVKGEIVPLSEVNDPTFSGGVLGPGVAILPENGKFYAPFDGIVSMIFDTKHAIGITSNNGVEVMMHVGLETVSLQGEGFDVHVKVKDKVKKGDLLLSVNLDMLKEKGFDIVTPIILSDMKDSQQAIILQKSGIVENGTPIIEVE